MAERLHDSNGILSDERLRNTVTENHRRTAAATAEFRDDAKQNYPTLSAQSKLIRSDQDGLQQTQKSLATIQQQFHELDKNTASYINQINGKVTEMSQITANNEEALEGISTTQHSVSSQVAKAQQNLLKISEILKRISSK
ncbi:hypothetical protein ACSF3O_03140 [Acinetobacter soli]|uniref:hypothetical protein n=1 Tax=Acinetobacter soli TaxID=487316 RepID=UPI002590C7F8|nr:hypothetical protein [uncultured Acinetobacter sp.]